jgi:iron-sulfur cluster repair protein YtfE (RIC family)
MDASLAPYHQHHQELLRLAGSCETRLDPTLVRNHPDLCLAVVRRLVGLAKAHLAMENTILYPALLSDTNANILAAARALEADLGDLSTTLREYGHHWTSPETIRRAPEAFIGASLDLVKVLRHRIEVEESSLFPLVERA